MKSISFLIAYLTNADKVVLTSLGLNDRLLGIRNIDAVDLLDLDQVLFQILVQSNDPAALPFACFIGQVDMIANVPIAKLQDASKALKQAQERIAAAEDKVTALEFRAQSPEAQLHDAKQALLLVEEAIRERLLSEKPSSVEKQDHLAV